MHLNSIVLQSIILIGTDRNMSLTEIYYTHKYKSCHYFPLTDNKEDNFKKSDPPDICSNEAQQ